MVFSIKEKQKIKRQLAGLLSQDEEVTRVVVFGSFNRSKNPRDIDVAVFLRSKKPYLPLAMKYRRRARPISKKIPVDIIPVRLGAADTTMLAEIKAGETVYEK
jgi:uncharacterized protein